MDLDFDASLGRLAKWLARARESGWSPTPEEQRLRSLAQTLERAAEALGAAVAELGQPYQWLGLEELVDGGHPGRFGCATPDAVELSDRLREIADRARELADAMPDPRARPALAWTADVFLHLWREAERERPTLTGSADARPSEAVLAFQALLEQARIVRSPERARELLAEALERYDPGLATSPDWREIAVWLE